MPKLRTLLMYDWVGRLRDPAMNQDQPAAVHSDPRIMGGTPVFVGTRVPFQTLLDYLEAGQPLRKCTSSAERIIMRYTITVRYEEDDLRASLHCPLCDQEREFPFPAREVHGSPQPAPKVIVEQHLYGDGVHPTQCQAFLGGPVLAKQRGRDTVELTLEPIML